MLSEKEAKLLLKEREEALGTEFGDEGEVMIEDDEQDENDETIENIADNEIPTVELSENLPEYEPLPLSEKPITCIVIGMAGSGKTTLMQRINAYVNEFNHPSYIVNLDPAVLDVPYGAHIDIRDTVNYKQVMKQYNLGPNGGILTSLNLFATRFDQVVQLIDNKARYGFTDNSEGKEEEDTSMNNNSEEDKKKKLEYVFVDTPGQIEIFTWSASGQVISESLAATFPTCILYVIDTPRNTSPITFMSNMLYACSILYKTRLPFLIVFNKIDVARHDFAKTWMSDFEAFQLALNKDESYSSTLANSMCLVLDEFYANIDSVGVSAMTGEGMDEMFEILNKKAKEYEETYYNELEKTKKKRDEIKLQKQEEEMRKLEMDFQRFNTSSSASKKKKQDEEEKELQDFLSKIKQ
ncbi:hypothetical protein ABK040_008913 [Willaertia magna]